MISSSKRKGHRTWLWFISLSIILGFFAVSFSGSWPNGTDIEADAPLEDFTVHLERRISRLMKVHGIPGCQVALVHDYEIVWTSGFGLADVESGRYLTADTPMSVQSITKSIVAWGIAKLAEQGLIDLDVPLSHYLAEWDFPQSDNGTEGITIRNLLNHTSGMPLGDFTDVYSPGEEMPSLRSKLTEEAVLLRKPGVGFSYSNVGYHLLELLIEEVTGRDFVDYMYSEVFLPLDMTTATFEPDSSMMPYPPTGYDLRGKPVPVYVYPQKASGGLFATAEDIARFVVASMKDVSETLYTPQVRRIGIYGLVFEAYGAGHYIETLPNGLPSVAHGGQGKGIMTHFHAVPETGDAIVILTNSQRSWPFISIVLSDWARWRSFPSVGMGRIVWAHLGLSAVIGMLFSASILVAVELIRAYRSQQRIRLRLLRFNIACVLLGTVAYSASQEYLFISSVFPSLTVWLGGGVLTFSIVLLLSALPRSLDKNNELLF
ncbi:MAG TPA: beta-lactamase family protein [Firmicutes bacterium]|nr:beta-lactamase family protein [Bacillota bacterium]